MAVASIVSTTASAPPMPHSGTRSETHRPEDRVAEPDREAPVRADWFADIAETIQTVLYLYVRRLTTSAEDARDIVQDVYLAAWRALQDGQAPFVGELDEIAVRRWLFCVAYRRAVSLIRHHRVIPWQSLDTIGEDDISGPGAQAWAVVSFDELIAESHMVRAALAQLQPEDAACLLMSVVQGFTTKETAQILGITLEAARKRLSRAMKRLRVAYLAQEAQDQECSTPT